MNHFFFFKIVHCHSSPAHNHHYYYLFDNSTVTTNIIHGGSKKSLSLILMLVGQLEVLRRFCLISVIGASVEILGSSISESTGSVINNESVSTMLGASVVFDSVTLMNVGRLDGGDCDAINEKGICVV